MKVVFDTNIFISALVFPGSLAEKAILKVVEGKDQLLISRPILVEILRVLSRKFSRNRESIARTALWISEIATLIEPSLTVRALKDEPDNRILECAIAGHADAVVTGDKEMLGLSRYRGIPIMTLRRYLDV